MCQYEAQSTWMNATMCCKPLRYCHLGVLLVVELHSIARDILCKRGSKLSVFLTALFRMHSVSMSTCSAQVTSCCCGVHVLQPIMQLRLSHHTEEPTHCTYCVLNQGICVQTTVLVSSATSFTKLQHVTKE